MMFLKAGSEFERNSEETCMFFDRKVSVIEIRKRN